MRQNPILSEEDAFQLTVTGVVFAIVGVVIGWLVTPIAGIALFVVLAAIGLVAHMRRDEPRERPLRQAHHAAHHRGAPPGRRHVIVVANETLAGEELSRCIEEVGDHVDIDVLAPVLTSRTHLAYTDIDGERAEARDRLAHSLEWAREHGFLAYGKIGDPSPTTALEDELRAFGADEVIVVTADSEPTRWQERTELDHLREELSIPVVHVSVGSRA